MNNILKNIPNILSILRIILTPFCVFFLLNNTLWLSFILFCIASITDYFDGYLARKYNNISKLGAFLDPLADKIMTVSVFVCFYRISPDIVDIYILSMILFRDVFVTILRILMESYKATLITSKVSKVKTAVQIGMIILIFFNMMFEELNFSTNILYAMMLLTASLTFYTGLHYLFYNYKEFQSILMKND